MNTQKGEIRRILGHDDSRVEGVAAQDTTNQQELRMRTQGAKNRCSKLAKKGTEAI